MQINSRFGFEEPRSAGEDRQVFRTGINFTYMFSARLQATLGMNILHEVSTSEGADEEFIRDTLDGNLNLQYFLTRDFTLTLTYSYTSVGSNNALTEYDRSRFFFGGQYAF